MTDSPFSLTESWPSVVRDGRVEVGPQITVEIEDISNPGSGVDRRAKYTITTPCGEIQLRVTCPWNIDQPTSMWIAAQAGDAVVEYGSEATDQHQIFCRRRQVPDSIRMVMTSVLPHVRRFLDPEWDDKVRSKDDDFRRRVAMRMAVADAFDAFLIKDQSCPPTA